MVGHTHARAATPPGKPEAGHATASIPIASGSLYRDRGRRQGGERLVSGMEFGKHGDWCGNQEERGKM